MNDINQSVPKDPELSTRGVNGLGAEIQNYSHAVYLIETVRQTTKIGHSRDVPRRLKNLQIGAGERLTLAHEWRMPRDEAVAFEGRLHRLLRWARITGEWHGLGAAQIKKLGDMVLGGEGAEAYSAALLRYRDAEAVRATTYEAWRRSTFRPAAERAVLEQALDDADAALSAAVEPVALVRTNGDYTFCKPDEIPGRFAGCLAAIRSWGCGWRLRSPWPPAWPAGR